MFINPHRGPTKQASYLMLEMPALSFHNVNGREMHALPNQALLLLFTLSRLLQRTPMVPIASRTSSQLRGTPNADELHCFNLNRIRACSSLVPTALITSGGFKNEIGSLRTIRLVKWDELASIMPVSSPKLSQAQPSSTGTRLASMEASDLLVVRVSQLHTQHRSVCALDDWNETISTVMLLSAWSRECLRDLAIPSHDWTHAWAQGVQEANKYLKRLFANDTDQAMGCVESQGFQRSCVGAWSSRGI